MNKCFVCEAPLIDEAHLVNRFVCHNQRCLRFGLISAVYLAPTPEKPVDQPSPEKTTEQPEIMEKETTQSETTQEKTEDATIAS